RFSKGSIARRRKRLFQDGIPSLARSLKLVNIYKNYKDGGYKQAIEDYFK
ncbi:8561_t:CDS:1, partial [Funneliformis geosporum]